MTENQVPDQILAIGDNNFALYLDEKAREQIQHWIEELGSSYLRRNVVEFHRRDGHSVQMLRRINLLLAIIDDSESLVGFIAVEQEGENDFALLHMIYVKKEFRGAGYATALVKAFELLALQYGVKTLRLLADSRVSLGFFERRARKSRLSYDIVKPTSEVLDYGDLVFATEI